MASASTDISTLSAARNKLSCDLTKWRTTQFTRFPSLRDRIPSVNPDLPEDELLLLPSSFNEPHRAFLGLTDLGKVEHKLREGRAHDALETLRLAIKTFNFNRQFKVNFVHGQGPNTRAQDFLATLTADKVSAADEYRRARAALLTLGLPSEDKSLQPLSNSELWGKDTSKLPELGDSKRVEPWFWTAGRPSNLSTKEEAEWSAERECSCLRVDLHFLISISVDRVQWFRDQAGLQRCREEKEVLEEEFRRTHTTFRRLAEVWLEMATSTDQGYACYAHKQSAMLMTLKEDCSEAMKELEIPSKFTIDPNDWI